VPPGLSSSRLSPRAGRAVCPALSNPWFAPCVPSGLRRGRRARLHPAVKSSQNIELQGDELCRAEEPALSHHYELNYTPPDTESGRPLARR
jgi:hypothetical protein